MKCAALWERNTYLQKSTNFIASSKQVRFLSQRETLPHPSKLFTADTTLRNSLGWERSESSILGILSKMHRSRRDLWWCFSQEQPPLWRKVIILKGLRCSIHLPISWFKYAHHGWLQATTVTSFKSGLGRDESPLAKPPIVNSYLNQLLLWSLPLTLKYISESFISSVHDFTYYYFPFFRNVFLLSFSSILSTFYSLFTCSTRASLLRGS